MFLILLHLYFKPFACVICKFLVAWWMEWKEKAHKGYIWTFHFASGFSSILSKCCFWNKMGNCVQARKWFSYFIGKSPLVLVQLKLYFQSSRARFGSDFWPCCPCPSDLCSFLPLLHLLSTILLYHVSEIFLSCVSGLMTKTWVFIFELQGFHHRANCCVYFSVTKV